MEPASRRVITSTRFGPIINTGTVGNVDGGERTASVVVSMALSWLWTGGFGASNDFVSARASSLGALWRRKLCLARQFSVPQTFFDLHSRLKWFGFRNRKHSFLSLTAPNRLSTGKFWNFSHSSIRCFPWQIATHGWWNHLRMASSTSPGQLLSFSFPREQVVERTTGKMELPCQWCARGSRRNPCFPRL